MNATKIELSLDNNADKNRYEEMLDECYGDVKIAGLEYNTSHALKNVDETAYRCGFLDWADGEERNNPVWECSECGQQSNDEEEAEECCTEQDEETKALLEGKRQV